MACVRKRRGKWVVDYRDAVGLRRWVTCDTRREAEAVLEKALAESRNPIIPVVDPDITIKAYSERWLGMIPISLKPRTVESYSDALRLHLLPRVGAVKVRQLHRGQIKTLLGQKLADGLSRGTVRIIHATLRAMLNAAVEDGVIAANPADKLGRHLKLVPAAATRQEDIKAMTREQLAAFLAAANCPEATEIERRHGPLFLLLARTGMRVGEAFALQWPDVDTDAREIRVARAFSDGRLETPKSGHGRTVDMSAQLAAVLRRLLVARKAETLKRGWRELPPWVFCSEAGTPLNTNNLRRVFRRVLKRAKLPEHFSPHSLRHTFASLLLQQGESPVYVQRQLGHSSIKLTVDTYGKWLPMGNKAAVDRLDDSAPGSKVVARLIPAGERAVPRIAETPEIAGEEVGEPCGTRTHDPLIKSQVLYRLS